MITLKGAEVSAKIKEQVLSMNQELNGYVPTAAIVRIGERPDDLSYERNVMKRIAAYGMEAKSFAYPADISEEEFFAIGWKVGEAVSTLVFSGITGSFKIVFAAVFGVSYAPLVITGLHHMSNAIDLQLIADYGGTMLWPAWPWE